MKKAFIVLLVSALIFGCSLTDSLLAEDAAEYISGDFSYSLLEDGTVEIAEYNSKSKDLIDLAIPNTLDGKLVTSIDERALLGYTKIEKVIINEGLRHLAGNPFYGLESLSRITVSPDHQYFATIGGVLFQKPEKRLVCYPSKLSAESYEIPDGIKVIGKTSFFRNQYLKRLTIPNSVTVIEESAFTNCSGLKNITLPNSIQKIGDDAFFRCSALNSLSIPDSVSVIGDSAFAWCDSLLSVSIGLGIQQLGGNPFFGCAKLSRIDISTEHPYLEVLDDVLFTKPDRRLIFYPRTLSMNIYEIPHGTKIIGEGAFSNCNTLTSVIVPEGVTHIGVRAFVTCDALTEIILPNGVQRIDDYAFLGCKNLASLSLPDSINFIGESAFGSEFSPCEKLVLTVGRESYAKEYAEMNNIPYAYPDSNDWLNN